MLTARASEIQATIFLQRFYGLRVRTRFTFRRTLLTQFYPRCSRTTPAISAAQAWICSWFFPSIMTRRSGSVPEYVRAAVPGRRGALRRAPSLPQSTALRQRLLLANADVHEHLRIGHGSDARSLSSRPLSAMTRSTLSAVTDTVAGEQISEKMMCPDCSPPIDKSRLIISSITYLSPTGAAHEIDPLAAAQSRGRCCSSPSPRLRCPSADRRLPMPRAHEQHGVAIDDTAVVIHEDGAIAVAIERHPHPAAEFDGRPGICSGWVDPQSRLMFRPSGCALSTCTSKPSSRNNRGATVVVAPLAVSIASGNLPAAAAPEAQAGHGRYRHRSHLCDPSAVGVPPPTSCGRGRSLPPRARATR